MLLDGNKLKPEPKLNRVPWHPAHPNFCENASGITEQRLRKFNFHVISPDQPRHNELTQWGRGGVIHIKTVRRQFILKTWVDTQPSGLLSGVTLSSHGNWAPYTFR